MAINTLVDLINWLGNPKFFCVLKAVYRSGTDPNDQFVRETGLNEQFGGVHSGSRRVQCQRLAAY